ncbi:hypothetical protein ALC56_09231 [Trachymyrmex septentrionalis]|uniref:Uncharacterized protein n=1 Tax=Trachymyrmex septentrionalis TaxID=34720 RepID=A0A195F7A9_9HYME|nr:hypothetical protein ALC56_09231 [Trachymyrmex septentrionalis]
MSSRLALPVSGPAHKDRDTYTVAAGTKPYERVQVNARIISMKDRARKNWNTVYVGEKGFYCD